MHRHLSAVSKNLVGNVHPLEYVKTVFPPHLNGTPFALALMLKVGEQNVIAQITVVQIPDHKHTNGVIRISVNDHCRLVGRFRGGNIICMKLDTVRIDNKSIFECVCLAQTIHPWAEEWIVSVHIGIRVSVFRQYLGIRGQREIQHIETPADCATGQQQHDNDNDINNSLSHNLSQFINNLFVCQEITSCYLPSA